MKQKIIIPEPSSRLHLGFFARHAEDVARDLLGRVIVINRKNKDSLYARISEVAAFEGKEDSMYNGALYHPGLIAVSTKFGKQMIDISTLRPHAPSCVTLIAAEVLSRDNQELVKGPGNLTSALKIDSQYDGLSIDSEAVWIGGESVDSSVIRKRNLSGVPANCKGYFYIRQ